MYQAQAAEAQPEAEAGAADHGEPAAEAAPDEDVVEADYEIVDEEK